MLSPKLMKDVISENYQRCHTTDEEPGTPLFQMYRKSSDQTNLRSVSESNWNRGVMKIELVDTGCGVANEAIANLFHPYAQEDSSITRNNGGLGLGLYIVDELVKKMNGNIKLTSHKGEGTRVIILIPAERKEEPSKQQSNYYSFSLPELRNPHLSPMGNLRK